MATKIARKTSAMASSINKRPKRSVRSKPSTRSGIDMLKYCGSIRITMDPLAYQRDSRG